MRYFWTYRDIDAPAEALWELLTNPDDWPEWGPSILEAHVHGGRMEQGATGTVTTAVGVDLGFEITAFEPGARWAWKVAGIGATDHRVEPRGPAQCRVGFGVPLVAAPYLAVCRVALARLETIASHKRLLDEG